MLILIMGGPRSGKTTLGKAIASELGIRHRSTDDWIGKTTFKLTPVLIVQQAEQYDNLVLEGTYAPRLVKYGLKPDLVIRLQSISPDKAHASLNAQSDNYAGHVDIELARPFNLEKVVKEISENRR